MNAIEAVRSNPAVAQLALLLLTCVLLPICVLSFYYVFDRDVKPHTEAVRSNPAVAQVALLLLACVLLPICVLSFFYVFDKDVKPRTEFLLSNFEYVASHANEPEAVSGEWRRFDRSIEVPDDPYASVWIRTDVTRRLDLSRATALYIPKARANVQVWLRGKLQHTAAPIEEPLAFIKTPLLIPLGEFDTSVERTWMHIRLTKARGFLMPPNIYLAPYAELTTAYRHTYWIAQTLPKLLVAVALTMTALVGGLFIMRPQDTAYGWYALYMFLWTAHTAHALVDNIPIHHELWFALTYLSLALVPCEVIFINRYFDLRMRWVEKLIAIVTTLLASTLLLPAVLGLKDLAYIATHHLWMPWIMLLGLFVFVQCFMAVRRSWSIDSIGLLLSSSIFVVVGIRDHLFDFHDFVPGTTYYLQFIVVIPLLFFGFLLLRRHVRALRLSEKLNAELEERVSQKAQQLEDSYRKLTEEEKRREVAEERARLMRDMHDGLGGHLVHALSLAENKEDRRDLKQALRYALSDLRLIVDSLAPSETGFSSLLANFRHRISKSVGRAGIEMQWTLSIADDVSLKADQSLALLRIIQEATTNALRHSECKTIRISVSTDAQTLEAEIRDDGKGIESRGHGRGLDNMQIRAASISARLAIDSNKAGTSVRCIVPIADGASPC
ncbi:MAG: ATP-binding protein [Pseudomonadota bacterium]